MIRLTDEEIGRVVGLAKHTITEEAFYQFHSLDKAQLKKVVEYILLHSYLDESLKDSTNGRVHLRGEALQALLEEVKD